MIGGVLVERTVNEVLPALEQNREQVRDIIIFSALSYLDNRMLCYNN